MGAPQRNRLIGAVHAAKKAAALDDDTYRAKLALITGGKTSAKDLTDSELRRVLDAMNGKGRHAAPRTTSPTAKKARALWISLHCLGGISDPSENALRAWVKRQYHVDDLAFVRPSQSFAVIEGLKQWCVRLGVDWGAFSDPRHAVIFRQLDIIQTRSPGEWPGCDGLWASVPNLNQHQLDQTIVDLGHRVRGENG